MAFKMKPSPFKNLRRWFEEEWETPRGNKDYSEGENTFRPTKRISKDTPATWDELTPAEKTLSQPMFMLCMSTHVYTRVA